MQSERSPVVVGLSGGVDSAVAAALLREAGRDVIGVVLRMQDPGDDGRPACPAAGALDDARRVAEVLGIPLHVVDATEVFERAVVEPFCAAYARGRTPNPCVPCNEQVKFALLRRTARELGASAVATGHYARRGRDAATGRFTLRRGVGAGDQAYFLFRLTQDHLRDAVFPLGEHDKERVRRRAREYGLPVHDRPDSQDLCFVPAGRYREFLRARSPEAFRPGPIVHTDGRVLGRHDGIGGYTVGQRRGLGIAHSEPLYVVAVRPDQNSVVVGERQHVMGAELAVEAVHWVSIPPPADVVRATVKIRYNHPGAPASVTPQPGGTAHVRFEAPQEAPAPGQAAVFYAGDLLLGGGTIAGNNGTQPGGKR
ncbi:MAG: tRNA 2-thiouridine(34) synthase MnmA [Candidatus Brocadiaceae bacterium]|nr:tRNA 2-thiouridine(34) synthase MnmA [Candidatus Brocadiaceae bacterium]